MIKVLPLKLEELKDFEPKDQIVDLVDDMKKNLLHPDREVVGLWKLDKMVCIAGVNHLRAGVAEVWIIPSHLVDVYKCEFFKAIYRLIHCYLFNQCGLHRVTMAIEYGWEKGMKWAEKLGFHLEGLMEAYDNNYTDHYLYAKVVA